MVIMVSHLVGIILKAFLPIPALWPADPIAANKVQDIKRAIIFIIPGILIRLSVLKIMSRRLMAGILVCVRENWRQDKKVHKFVKWCRQEA